ncbi:MAG: SGNH/GDSL hydrolase family protein [Tateyamaria sp.]|uniref:SGNH/GDSL hydrolase family protein n=1 Tax=Tateyamaria sp. TaxID=1929288 RepID=UPI0032A07667
MRTLMGLLAMLAVVGCVESVPTNGTGRILMMGDSMFAVYGGSRQSVSDRLELRINEPVVDRSVVGAQFLYALPISGSLGLRIGSQYVSRKWDWVVVNGGGNDLWLACGCRRCDGQLNRMVSETGDQGTIVDVVNKARADGAKVLFVGYLRTPGVPSAIDHCAAHGNALEARLKRMAQRDAGVTYLSIADLVPNGDRSFHDADLIHPSPKGSDAIAARIANAIR